MDQFLVQSILNNNGEIVEAYDQALDPRRGFHVGGWCAGCAARWLVCKRQHRDFWAWFATGEAATLCRSIQTQAKLKHRYDGMGGSEASLAAVRTLLQGFGLFTMPAHWAQYQGGAALAASLINGGGNFVFVGLSRLGGAHAFAALRGAYSMSIFDANCGELNVPRNRLATFMPLYMTAMGYGVYDQLIVQRFG